MGLTLNKITARQADGQLDGLPFSLKADDGKWAVRIGGSKAWRHEGELRDHPRGATLLISEIRALAYMAIAKYRDAMRKPARA